MPYTKSMSSSMPIHVDTIRMQIQKWIIVGTAKMREFILKFIFLVICIFSPACIEGGFFTPREPAMCPGMNIDVARGSERLKISAEGIKTRKYEIEGQTIRVDLRPRSSRWRGSLGLYLPSGTDKFHLVLDEGQQHFYSEKEARDWINIVGDRLGYVYSSDGLVVGWKLQELTKSDQKAVLHVDLWQIYIQGEKPVSFKGADDKSINVSRSSKSCRKFKYSAEFSSSSPKTLEGRNYSGKVIDLMNEMEIDPDRVEQAIKFGRPHSKGVFIIYQHYKKGSNSIWVALDKSKKVVHIDR
jgi:hypothetical protein